MYHLRELRTQKGLTQAELSKALQVSASSIGMYEQGRREPDNETLGRIANFFHVSTDYLLGRTDEPHTPAPAEPPAPKPELNARDERDIQKKLQSILDDLDPDTGLAYYNGQEPMDDETRDLIRSSIENSLRTAKQLAKTKYTPKKYRNE